MGSVEQMAVSAEVISSAEIAALRFAYPDAALVPVPLGSGASLAWFVRITPFSNPDKSLHVCEALFRNETLSISAGSLVPSQLQLQRSALQINCISKQLVDLTQTFEVLILEFADGRQPYAFVLNPEISRQSFPNHPHLREDKVIRYKGRNLCAICYYFSPDFQLIDRAVVRLNSFDFVSYFLAKHLIWCRTRSPFYRGRRYKMFLPNEVVLPEVGLGSDYSMQQSPCLCKPFMQGNIENPIVGLWFGAEAPHIHSKNITLPMNALCHCGLNREYADCHYQSDLRGLKLVDKLINPYKLLQAMRMV